MLILQSYLNLPILQENSEKKADIQLSKLKIPHAKLAILVSKLDGFKLPESYLAKELECDERSIRRYKQRLHQFGIIDFKQRHMYEPCVYTITEYGKQVLPDIFTRYSNLTYYKLHIAPFVNDEPEVQKTVLPNSYLVEKDLLKTGPDRKHVYAGIPARDKVTARKEDCRKNVSKRKESRVMELPDIPEHIQVATKMLGLTLTGQLKLMSFTQATVEHGLEQVKHMKGSKDVYKQLMEECKQFSAANDQVIDWQPYLRLAEANPDKLNKLGPFTSAKVRSIPAQNTGANHKPYVPDADLLRKEKERMMAKQKAWEATKTKEQLDRRLEEGKFILRALNVSPQNGLTEEQLRSVQTKRETIAKFEAIEDLDPIRKIILENWKQELKELEALQAPRWPQDVQEDIDWFKQYVSKMTVTKHSYKPILDRIEQGPTGPWAVTGELQKGLRWAREQVSTEAKSRIDSPAKEEPVELIDEDQAFDEV